MNKRKSWRNDYNLAISQSSKSPSTKSPSTRRKESCIKDRVLKEECSKMEKLVVQLRGDLEAFKINISAGVSGHDIVNWVKQRFNRIADRDAAHIASLISKHGYIYPRDDCNLGVKDEAKLYFFQDETFWMSNMGHLGHREYAIYLCKQDMGTKQRFLLEEYEEEHLSNYHYVTMPASWEDIEDMARH